MSSRLSPAAIGTNAQSDVHRQMSKLIDRPTDIFSNEMSRSIETLAENHTLPLIQRLKILRKLEEQLSRTICEKVSSLETIRERWSKRVNPDEEPMNFVNRVYSREITEGLTISDLKMLDLDLFLAVSRIQGLSAHSADLSAKPKDTTRTRPDRHDNRESARLNRLLSVRTPRT